MNPGSAYLCNKAEVDINPDFGSHSPDAARSNPANVIWQDPFLLDSLMSDEEGMIREWAGYFG